MYRLILQKEKMNYLICFILLFNSVFVVFILLFYLMVRFCKILLNIKMKMFEPIAHIHSFIQQIIIQHLLWVHFCCRCLFLYLVAQIMCQKKKKLSIFNSHRTATTDEFFRDSMIYKTAYTWSQRIGSICYILDYYPGKLNYLHV